MLIWNQYANDREALAKSAAQIRAVILDWPEALQESPPDHDWHSKAETSGTEGAVMMRMHKFRERDGKVARDLKSRVLKTTGKLACEACKFDFEATYGDRGLGLMDAHHRVPLESLEPGTLTKESDLALLCSNCHRLIHSRRPWLSVDELKAILEARALPTA